MLILFFVCLFVFQLGARTGHEMRQTHGRTGKTRCAAIRTAAQ